MIKFNKKTAYAYLMGVYLGDGEINIRSNFEAFRLNTKDKDFAETTKNAINIKILKAILSCAKGKMA